MIRRVFRYRLKPKLFLKEIPTFIGQWFVSRHWWFLLTGLPAVLFSVVLLSIFLHRWLGIRQEELARSYQERALTAVAASRISEADVYLARTIDLATDRKAKSLEIGTLLNERGHEARALEILTALAPLRHRGYPPAHTYLAQYWHQQQPKTDVTTVIAMYHEMHANGQLEEPRLRLASLLSERGYQNHAAACLTTLLKPGPSARLQLVQIYGRSERQRAALRQAELAEKDLREELERSPEKSDVRVLLSKSVACQDRILEAIYILAEGCESDARSPVVDQLIHFYMLWLSSISEEKLPEQLHQLAMAVDPDTEPPENHTQSELTLSSGAVVPVPQPIAEFHRSLLAGHGKWLIPVLQGSAFAARGDFEKSVERLSRAREYRPEHPVISNNLAWVLLKQHQQLSLPMSASASSKELRQAWELAEFAVAQMPHEPSFLENTRPDCRCAWPMGNRDS